MRGYLTGMWQCRYFWLSLVRLDLRQRYRRSFLGLGWSLLHPIAMTAILCTVFHQLFQQDVRDFAPYLLAGLAIWNYVVFVTLQGCQCFLLGEPYIRQYPLPMAIYPLRTTLAGTFHFLVALTVLLPLTIYCKGPHLAALLGLVPALVLLFAFAWSSAVLAGLANVYLRDTQHLLEVGFQILFYATPIMYRPQMLRQHHLTWMLNCNPLVPFLQLIREPLLDGRLPAAATFGVAALTVAATASVALFALLRWQRKLVFNL
jgi:ABC-type polysaccharide/polyol phosphate export permease